MLDIRALLAQKFTADDAQRAFDDWGCNCGPGAIAGVLGLTLDEVRPHIPEFDTKRYTNPTMMNAALRSLGIRFAKVGRTWPGFGLMRIQWEGPWTEPGVPMAARYRYTHWIGGFKGLHSYWVFDINAINNGSGWTKRENWEAHMVPLLCSLYSRAYGSWHLTHALEISTTDRRG